MRSAAGQIQAPSTEQLADHQIELLQQWAEFEYLADFLQFGSAAEIMDIFRERRKIEWQVERILNHLKMKSEAA